MDYFMFIPLIAFLINGFTWTIVYAQRRNHPVNRDYLLLAGAIQGWLILNLFFKMRINVPENLFLFKLNSVFWLMLGFLFLHFVYTFLNKSKDVLYRIFGLIAVVSVGISLTTGLVIRETFITSWGINQRGGELFLPLILLSVVAPIVYALSLCYTSYRRTNDIIIRNQLLLLFLGTALASALSVTSAFLNELFQSSRVILLSAEACLFQSIAIYFAISKFHLMMSGIEEVALDIFDNAYDSILVLDRHDHIVHANQAALELWKDKSSLKFLPIQEILPDYNPSVPYNNQETSFDMPSQKRTMLISEISMDQNSKFSGKVLVFRDISDLKKTQEELLKSQKQLQRIVDHANDGIDIVEYDPASNVRKLVMANDSYIRMSGYSREELMNCDDLNKLVIFHNFVKSPSVTIVEDEDFYQGVSSWNRPDGKECTYEWTAVPWRENGKLYMVGIDRDITERKLAEEALMQSRMRYQKLVEFSPNPIVVHSDGKFIFANNAAVNFHGLNNADELIGQDVLRFVHPSGHEAAQKRMDEMETISRHLLTQKEIPFFEVNFVEERFVMPDGSVKIASVGAHPMDFYGNPAVMVVIHDITDQKEVELALRESEQRYRMLFDLSPYAILLIEPRPDDTFWPIVECNQTACDMNGYTRDELIGQSLDIIHPTVATLEERQETYRKFINGERMTGIEYLHQRKDGAIFPVETNGHLITFGNRQLILGIDRDITERKRAEETIKYQAFYDTLTGLPNRTLFADRLSLALNQAQRTNHVMAVLFLDIDRFKKINDTLGHDMGDELLRMIGERLKPIIDEGDTLARFGGDEWVILQPQIQRIEDSSRLAQGIIDHFKQPFKLNALELYISFSIGIAIYPNDGEDSENLLKNAAAALYRAKEQGRNNYQYYTPSINAKASERLALESNLRQAVERGEMEVYYQPQIRTDDQQVVGMEALIRWNHPRYGLVSPAEFIPLAEETGLIVSIGEWVLRTACKQNKRWHDQGYSGLRIAVNLSARQFLHSNLIDMVKKALNDSGLAPNHLELEITESIAMQNADYTIKVLQEMKAMGVHISLDDFGTGYSSFGYLRSFPLHSLKIDRSFIRGLSHDSNDAAIAETIILLAHSMKMDVVAEGVETEEQVVLLKERKCDLMQGFLFSRPIPAHEFEKSILMKSQTEGKVIQRSPNQTEE